MSELREKYTGMRECVVPGAKEDMFTVYLAVPPQYFTVTPFAVNKEEAEWYRDMLAKAIERLIEGQ